MKCFVQNIVVDLSFNQLGGLSTLCFLEQVTAKSSFFRSWSPKSRGLCFDHMLVLVLCEIIITFLIYSSISLAWNAEVEIPFL